MEETAATGRVGVEPDERDITPVTGEPPPAMAWQPFAVEELHPEGDAAPAAIEAAQALGRSGSGRQQTAAAAPSTPDGSIAG
jgi:hypothetical protein